MTEEQESPPRYLRFVRALLLSSVVTASLAAAGCDEAEPEEDAGVTMDAGVDAGIPDSGNVVDGPLPPPDLPRARV